MAGWSDDLRLSLRLAVGGVLGTLLGLVACIALGVWEMATVTEDGRSPLQRSSMESLCRMLLGAGCLLGVGFRFYRWRSHRRPPVDQEGSR